MWVHNTYEYQRSRSLFDLCPRSLRFINSNISYETAGPFEAKFRVELLQIRRTKVCSNGPGHITKMASMLIFGKTIKISSSKATGTGRWPLNLVYSIKYSGHTQFVQVMVLGGMARSNLLVWEYAQTADFMEAIEICLHGSRRQNLLEC